MPIEVSVAELYGLTGAQARMARAFLRWSAAYLAQKCQGWNIDRPKD